MAELLRGGEFEWKNRDGRTGCPSAVSGGTFGKDMMRERIQLVCFCERRAGRRNSSCEQHYLILIVRLACLGSRRKASVPGKSAGGGVRGWGREREQW